MQTIGERLEDARKKRSVTIEDAAEATKIRAEYLVSLEKNAGADIPLQTVYIRGFLKNYAKFLRLEPSRLVADFEAIRHAHTANESSGNAARAEKELIGRLELSASPETHASLPDEKEAPHTEGTEASGSLWGAFVDIFSDLPKWVIPTIIGVASILILWAIIGAIVSHKPAQPDVQQEVAAQPISIKLTALKDVTVIARDATSNTTLYAGTLKKDESIPVENKGSIRLQYSDGLSLQIDRDGQSAKAGTAGAGKMLIE